MNNRQAYMWAGQCLRKASYKSLEKAEKAVKKIRNTSGDKLDYYLCDHCLNYHLTRAK